MENDNASVQVPFEPGIISAFYSALRLLQLIDTVRLNDKYKLLAVDTNQIDDLVATIYSWIDLVEKLPSSIPGIKDMAKTFIDRAFDTSNIIDFHVVYQRLGISKSSFKKDLDGIIQQITGIIQHPALGSLGAEESASPNPNPDPRPIAYTTHADPVGIKEPFERIIEKLTNDAKNRQVISIVGMGGIGKTALARHVYDASFNGYNSVDGNLSLKKNHFTERHWVTASQQWNIRKILQAILNNEEEYDIVKLGKQLSQTLTDHRYLIVLDDLWSTEAWDQLAAYLPTDRQIRIIVTTRWKTVADYTKPELCEEMDTNTLGENACWELFSKIAFNGKNGSDELQRIGKSICRSCKGLPLSIVTIGGLLSKSDMTTQYWERVAKQVTSFVSSIDEDRCKKILMLSYDAMPIHLKLCFLDFAKYEEDEHIGSFTLLKNWVVDAIVKPKKDKGIDEVAEEYLNDLIDRNMIFVRYQNVSQTLGMHDLLHNLSRNESLKENIFKVLYRQRPGSHFHMKNCCDCNTMSITGFDIPHSFRKKPCLGMIFHQVRAVRVDPYMGTSGKCTKGHAKQFHSQHLSSTNSLSECDIQDVHYHGVGNDIIIIPSSSSSVEHSNYFFPKNLVWNVQELDDQTRSVWMLPQIKFSCFTPKGKPDLVFEQLIDIQRLWSGDIRMVPSLKRILGTKLYDLPSLHLFCSLRILGLRNDSTTIRNNHTKVIMQLPNLEVLSIFSCTFVNDKWCSVSEGEFKFAKLKILSIRLCPSLKGLKLGEKQFPKLQTLEIYNQEALEIDAKAICSITTLQSMILERCEDPVIESARKLLKKIRSEANSNFFVNIKVRREIWKLDVDGNENDDDKEEENEEENEEEKEEEEEDGLMVSFLDGVTEFYKKLRIWPNRILYLMDTQPQVLGSAMCKMAIVYLIYRVIKRNYS